MHLIVADSASAFLTSTPDTWLPCEDPLYIQNGAILGTDLIQLLLQKDKPKFLDFMLVDCHSVFKQNTKEICLRPWHSENSLDQTKGPL